MRSFVLLIPASLSLPVARAPLCAAFSCARAPPLVNSHVCVSLLCAPKGTTTLWSGVWTSARCSSAPQPRSNGRGSLQMPTRLAKPLTKPPTKPPTRRRAPRKARARRRASTTGRRARPRRAGSRAGLRSRRRRSDCANRKPLQPPQPPPPPPRSSRTSRVWPWWRTCGWRSTTARCTTPKAAPSSAWPSTSTRQHTRTPRHRKRKRARFFWLRGFGACICSLGFIVAPVFADCSPCYFF